MNDNHNHKYNNHIDYRKLWGSLGSDTDGPTNRHNPWRDTVVANLDGGSGSGEEVMQMDSFQMVATWQLGDTAPVCGIATVSDMTAEDSDVEHLQHKIKIRGHHNADGLTWINDKS